jgi:hypothetical protein
VAASQAAADAFEREKDAARQRELAAAQALAHEQRRRAENEAASARRLRWLALGLAAVSLVAVVLAASAFLSLRKAEEARARAREQAALADKSRKQAEEAVAKLQVENKRLEVARDQAQQYRESLTTLSNRIGSYGNPEWTKAAVAVEPLTARLRVRASAVPRRGVRTSTGDQTYDFALWIDGPDAALDRVKSVTYEFNHPTFRQKVQQSSDRAAKFRVGYVGWGCLASVIVTLEPVDAGREKSASIDFNMCGALGGDARS